jgi:hypothetical protein
MTFYSGSNFTNYVDLIKTYYAPATDPNGVSM